MLNWRKGKLRIGLSRHGMAALHTTGGWRPQTTVLTDQAFDIKATTSTDPQELLVQCQATLHDVKLSGMPVTIVLSDDWARLFMVTPPQNLASLEDCKTAAAMRFQSLYGESMANWQLAADWDARRPFLACCLPLTLLSALQQFAQNNQFHLVSVQPQFVASWNAWRNRLAADDWLGQVQDGILTLGASSRQSLHAIRSTNLSAGEQDGLWVQQHIAREALRLNLVMPRRLQVCGSYAPHWLSPVKDSAADGFICSALPDPFLAVNQHGVSPNIVLARSGMKL